MAGTRALGAKRDVHDVRDRLYKVAAPVKVPDVVDLGLWAGAIKDQNGLGKCTGEAFASAREWIARRYQSLSPTLSGLSLYVEGLQADGDFPNDTGAMPRTACKMLTRLGVCETSMMPDGVEIVALTADQVANAAKWRTGAYHRVTSVQDVLTCLSDPTPWPVLVAFQVPDSFMSQQVSDTGVMPVPAPGENYRGGHEVLCLGYDLPMQLALCQNSWGDGWGLKGWFWMPMQVLGLATTDLWMVHTGGPWGVSMGADYGA